MVEMKEYFMEFYPNLDLPAWVLRQLLIGGDVDNGHTMKSDAHEGSFHLLDLRF
jgi:hypothetical protein